MMLHRIFLILLLSSTNSNCLKLKSGKPNNSKIVNKDIDRNPVVGLETPSGYLCKSYLSKFRLPGFPFEFPPIDLNSDKKYLIFPVDTATNFQKNKKRCKSLGGELLNVDSAFEMQVLSCAIASPSYINSWNNDIVSTDKKCIKLFPKGYIIGKSFYLF